MIIVKAAKDSKGSVLPDHELLEAIAWVKRCSNLMSGFDADDFGEAMTPELRAHEYQLREEMLRG